MAKAVPTQFSMQVPKNQTPQDVEYTKRLEAYFPRSIGTNVDKLRNFAKFVPGQALAMFLAKHEIFQKILRVHGHIIECGVFLGGGLMTWSQLSAIYEPVNHVRRIVGFDTFTGFTGIDKKDKGGGHIDYARAGGLATHAQADIAEAISLYDVNRSTGHIPRVELVVGDAVLTIPQYLKANQHIVVAMLYLDFDLYEPSRVALATFLPRMPKGAILCFDELNQELWPGETLAALETVGLRNLRIERFPFTPQLSFAVLE